MAVSLLPRIFDERCLFMKIVCIGSSIVNGFPLKRSQCWVSLWRESSGHEIINKGVNGSTSGDMLDRFEADVLAHKPQMVCMMTGTNDFLLQLATPKEVLQNLVTMNDLAKKHNIMPVIVTSIPIDIAMASEKWAVNAGFNYVAVQNQLSQLGALIREGSSTFDIRILDFYHVFADKLKTDPAPALYVDGIHPTALGHSLLADAANSMIKF